MKRRGFSTPIFILVSCVVMMAVTHLTYISTIEANISIVSRDKIQTRLLAETKVNRVVYDNYYQNKYLMPAILAYLKAPATSAKSAKINVEAEDLDIEDKHNVVSIEFQNVNDRRCMEVVAESNYRGIRSISKKKVNYVNSIFEEGSLPLISYDLDFNTCVKLDEFYDGIEYLSLDSLPSDFKKLSTFSHDEIVIEAENNSRDIIRKISSSSTTEEIYGKVPLYKIFFDIKNRIYTPVSLRIIDKPALDPVKLKGVIIMEGDIIIEGRFEFSGIIVLKGRDSKIIVESDVYKPLIRGIIITEGPSDFLDRIDLKYNREVIGMYGFYLPGFIEIK
ncbi:hypothetical protein E9840_00950 [Tissierella creatinini]|nr:hypothetical protein E9840_00950 [Tissierella creatinini]TJX69081.1 hypothetical protein E8P77_00170 [Soehngenia saccharolytica]